MKTWRILSLTVLAFACAQFSSRSATALPSFLQAANTTAAQNGATAQSGTAASAVAQSAKPLVAQGPMQPITFSHQQHAGTLKMPCQYCHTTSRSGDALLIPPATFCMQCHRTIDATNPEIQKLAEYAKTNTPIPWIRVYQLPSFVSFSHRTHLQHGATCQQCHGNVAEQVRVSQEKDISMPTCIACHSAKKASTGCNTCHSLNQ